MAICDSCKLDMSDPTTTTCLDVDVEFPGGESMKAVPYEPQLNVECHDCGVRPGGLHHPGCDVEECPKCHTQLISCGCQSDPDEEEA